MAFAFFFIITFSFVSGRFLSPISFFFIFLLVLFLASRRSVALTPTLPLSFFISLFSRRVGARGSQKWTRVLLKVSGEALAGENGFGIDPDVVQRIAREVAEAAMAGVQVAVVVGGGNFFRGAQHEGKGLDRASADYMG